MDRGVEVSVVGDEWRSRSRQEVGINAESSIPALPGLVNNSSTIDWVKMDPRERVSATIRVGVSQVFSRLPYPFFLVYQKKRWKDISPRFPIYGPEGKAGKNRPID